MKALNVLNTIALAIPVSLGLLGIANESFFIYALVSTMATGFIQLLTGMFFWREYPASSHIKIYFALVAAFFLLLFTNITSDWYWYMPPALCLYLSLLIYTKKN
jgi:membrane protein DedA with SNARE-associated domain